ncbi:glyoxylase-like metal-dependent hydrolase (beta-lactamase superfamily II)/rhodanese-related sulfurtransferase [Streptomyces griseochromogenes]|uniref:Glyoxylase-like metal-dependent hydrolase (Beta-lactamase superfamily II)/rhodanese-related sulfurtransferase n=1 Tax=Streptomyces griseochromogenes TaxID=68214 RepID=A0A1B1AUA8_9ACTN|nr:MBL fold metallo-hydrolase [Streptomyces griseochromogenes]ANP50154.1 MBL fold metallo-hydrolase [Streptomyces griseochromogenes]MBP2048211.1 glyoxylase-like metal-dependent hydrolase (beta-lactamase superfamily II)/rhodanese-related sulfurtransferase [Streptomyces griseochromogenes]
MFFVDTIEVSGLGNRCYLAGGERTAVAVDPPRDIDRVITAAARRGVRISHVVETHIHNDYVTGGLELARVTGAAYLVPAGARVSFERTPVGDGDRTVIDAAAGLTLRAVATPGHTPHHMSYVLEEGGTAVSVFTGGSLLIGTVGRPDLVEPRLTERLARAQHASVHRLATELPDETAVLPTHGFGSFCSSAQAQGQSTTIGKERASNEALTRDVDTFVADLLAGLDDIPAYYTHMGPANAAGPAPIDLTPPAVADADEIAARLAAGEWVVDLRNRVAFAAGHVPGSFNFEAVGQLASYLAWLIPWGKPVTLLAESAEQLADAQRELVRVGMDRPAAAATGEPGGWVRPHEALASFPRAAFADLAGRYPAPDVVLLDVRRTSERSGGFVEGSLHIPVHTLHRRLGEIPAGRVWVHCAGGMRAAIAASLLDAAGRDVVAVDDVFGAAEEAGLPVRTG